MSVQPDGEGDSARTVNGPAAPGANTASTSKVTLERDRKRRALRTANSDVWLNGAQPPTGPFDSNIKKNTGFIKRVRQTLGLETKEQLLREMATLNLDKYIDEVIQAIPEGLSKCTTAKDCLAAAECLTALFERFGSERFAVPLASLLTSQLQMPSRTALQALPADQRERDEAARLVRQRILLRASAELAVVDIVRSEKGKGKATDEVSLAPNHEWLFGIVRDLLASDKEHVNVPILIALLKALGGILLGTVQRRESEAVEVGHSISEDPLVDATAQLKFRKLCEVYFGTLTRRMAKEHDKLQDQDKRNHEAYIRSGEVFEDRQQNYEKMTKNFEKLHEWGQTLSDLLGVEMPALNAGAKNESGVGLAVNMDKRTNGIEDLDAQYATGKTLWEDEDTRRFYEDVVDLADMVPPALLGHAKGQVIEPAIEAAEKSLDAQNEDSKDKKDATASPQLQEDTVKADDENTTLNAGPAAQLNALLARLPELSSRALIDSAAVDFAFLANKLARRKLTKQLVAVPRSRSDVIPYYARLVAALTRYMPDIGQGVIAALEDEFRYLQRKRIPELAETRAKNARFIGELVKFRVVPFVTTFHCFKVLLDDFHRTNVEMAAVLLETCGRFLLRSQDTSERMKSVLELLRRKRAAQNLDQRLLVMLDNAYYQTNPPEREAIEAKQRTPMELYIHSLIYDELTRHTSEVVLKRCRKLPWNDTIVFETLQNVFTRAWRVKFGHLHLLAVMLHELQTYHMDFVVYVIDSVCEQIRSGMETNIFRDNQRRVATIKYFGELYNYRLINTGLVFEVLWSLVTFGHPRGQPLPGQVSSIDAPDDYFRVRLVCTLLDTCGQCFDRGTPRKRLDDFLLFFNMYILSKTQPLTMDADFMLSDVIEVLRPKFNIKYSFEDAANAVDEMLAMHRARANAAQGSQIIEGTGAKTEADPKIDSEESSDSDSEEGDSEAESATKLKAPRHASKDDASTDSEDTSSSEDDGEGSDLSESGSDDEQEEEEAGLSRREGKSSVDEEEDEFSRELAKMMSESNAAAAAASAGRNQRNLFDIGMPFVKRAQAQAASAKETKMGAVGEQGRDNAAIAAADQELPPQHMRFSLLSKRGNKQQTHEVHVPMDAALAVHSRANEQQQLEERQQLKKLVLGMETREQSGDRSGQDFFPGRRGLTRPR